MSAVFFLTFLYTPNFPYMSVLLSASLQWIFGKAQTKGDVLLVATRRGKELTPISDNESVSR